MDQYISLQKIPSLNFGSLNSKAKDQNKKLCTKTTRQQQPSNQKSYSYIKSNRSFNKKGIHAHRLVQDAQDMQEQEFIKKYLQNPFFKTQVNLMLKDYSEKEVPENVYKVLNGDIMTEQEYQIRTLKVQREQMKRQGSQIQRKWLQWLKNAGIKPDKR